MRKWRGVKVEIDCREKSLVRKCTEKIVEKENKQGREINFLQNVNIKFSCFLGLP